MIKGLFIRVGEMRNYIVFIKNNESKVVQEEQMSAMLATQLKKEGFTQYPEAIFASDEREAIRKLNEKGTRNLNALAAYAGDIAFYCAVLVAGFLLALYFY